MSQIDNIVSEIVSSMGVPDKRGYDIDTCFGIYDIAIKKFGGKDDAILFFAKRIDISKKLFVSLNRRYFYF